MTREQREIIRKQIDTLMRERLEREPPPNGNRHLSDAPKRSQKVKSHL